MGTAAIVEKGTGFGAGNLEIVDTPELVTIKFDPRRAIRRSEKGNPMVCSTGPFMPLLNSNVRLMLHVKAPKNAIPEDEIAAGQ